jgi:hypothetical protein
MGTIYKVISIMRNNKKNWEIFSKGVKNIAIVCNHIPTTPALINNREKKMITLTDKETILVEYLIGTTEGNQVVCCEDFFPKEILEKLNVNFQQVKGVFGSLVNKNILYRD